MSCLDEHTPAPQGYIEWSNWAAKMMRSHSQHKCPECGKLAIWKRKKSIKQLAKEHDFEPRTKEQKRTAFELAKDKG